MNKIKLLVSAALIGCTGLSCVSVQASEVLADLEGRMEEMHVFNGGKYVFEGYKNNDQHHGVYYFDGKEDVEIEDVYNPKVYGDKYIRFEDDEKVFNIENGKREEITLEDIKDELEHNFKFSVVRKAERYESTPNISLVGTLITKEPGKEWFEYKVSDKEGKKSYTIYLNEDGEYIDASNFYNAIHYAKDENGEYIKDEKGKIKKINLSKASNFKDEGYKISSAETLFSDDEYIYRLVKIVNATNEHDSNTYLHKVTKKAGAKQNKGANMPESSVCYEIPENSDIENLLLSDDIQVKTVGESLYIMIQEGDKFNVTKIDFKKVKENTSKLDKKIVEIDKDFDEFKNETIKDYTLDVNGNLWILKKGEILKFDYNTVEEIYKVDRVMDRLDVYNDGNLAVWNTEHEVYAIVGSEEENAQEKVTGWVKAEDGTWSYMNDEGIKVTGWHKDNNNWYYLNDEGIMQTGWINVNSTWYYLNENGAMHTGWLKDVTGKWYYLNIDGSMAANTTINGYDLAEDGSWIQ